ncbi:Uu.00g124460.m01.CDS01 [Anthostomella pinea]|uniref:Uu.00g124460.m01.CDS01 n=1 Tax=Anthostomella pinea TaxID=933095 RepID=A0AAI8VHL6_9PEZI|nr:Uu.00g124460.m01.CDS01 [Anthostomella pinea]
MQSTPAIPPRPSRNQDKSEGSSGPSIPPRPSKRFNRSISPNPDRFAPSPLNESPFTPKSPRPGQSHLGDSIERATSVGMPNVGEEGQEYAAALEEMSSSPDESRRPAGSPEQTRTVGEDVKLHAPKPTMPAASAKQRVAAVTRTDSDRAATFGIGRPSTEEPPHSSSRSLKKKASTTSQLSHHSENHEEDHGIPEIGQRVPMLAFAGDVQAPSPAPPRASSVDSTARSTSRHHVRKSSSRGFNELPPGSYGLHGHGVASSDKLEKAYYEKHPDLRQREHYNHLHDRVKDYSMSSEDLNKIVRDTASRGAGFGTSTDYVGIPSEQVGFQASEEYTSRMSRPPSTAPITSPRKSSFSVPDIDVEDTGAMDQDDDDVIHVDEPGRRKAFVKYGNEDSADGYDAEEDQFHPVLASDEVAKDPTPYELQPAVAPTRERHGSTHEMEEPRSRPTSRPGSIYSPPPADMLSTPLADVEEYEPLFPEDEKSGKKQTTEAEKSKDQRRRFPSQDIWEDAPNSVHSTAEVSTPEPTGTRSRSFGAVPDVPPRDGETPAQAFARRQEELAEKEALGPDSFLHRQQRPTSWASHQPHLSKEMQSRPNTANRFPSRDVWEDTPDSLQFTTTVSTPQSTDDSQAGEAAKLTVDPATSTNKPTIPTRPKKQGSGDDATSKPIVPGRPKPRPSKPASQSQEPEAATKQKPAVPARPVGGKIAALQAGFMSDLNNRLRLGPQAPKKEETTEQEAPKEKEKTPLPDARKGRARGPQRRAPTKSKSPNPGTDGSTLPTVSGGKPVLSFSMTRTLFSIDEEGTVSVDDFGPEAESKPVLQSKVEEIHPEEQQPETADETEAKPTEIKNEGSESKKLQNESESTEPKPNEKSADKDTVEETKSLVTNMAGESILEETVQKKPGDDEVKEVESAKDEVIS